jgi:hypothetical protein
MTNEPSFKYPPCILWHSWTKWKTIEEGNTVRANTNARTGSFLIQKRKCVVCDKEEYNKQVVEIV